MSAPNSLAEPPPGQAPRTAASASCNGLGELIAQVLRSHPAIQARTKGVEASQAEIAMARWQFYPSVSLGVQSAKDSATSAAPSRTASLSVQQPLWSGGRIEANVQTASRKQTLAEAAVLESRLDVALKGVDAWASWLAATGRRVATDDAMTKLDQLDAMIRRRVDQQVSAMVDGQLMAVRLQQARAEQLAAQIAQDVAAQRLTQWVGHANWAPSMRAGELLACHRSWVNGQDLPVAASAWVDRQPAVLRNQAEGEVSAAEVEQRRAERWPTVFARLERQSNETGLGLGSGMSNRWVVGLQYTPGAGLSTLQADKASIARQQSLEQEGEALRRDWRQRMDGDLLEFQGNQQRLQLLEAARHGNLTLTDAYTRLFVAGRRSWLELLNVVREVVQSDIAASDLLATQVGLLHRLQLYRQDAATGSPLGGAP